MGKMKEKKILVPPPAPPGGCHHYVARKQRYCKMLVKPGASYCGEHMPSDRIPCPYDPGHTCPADNVDKHLQICNSRPPDTLPPYLVTGINSGEADNDTMEHLTVATVSDERLMEIIQRIESVFIKNALGNMIIEQLSHDILRPEVENRDYGPNILKHHVQNSSLLGHLSKSELLSDNVVYIEFGSGRAALSYWIGKALANPGTCEMLLVDKASPRHKLDTRLKQETGTTGDDDDDTSIKVSRLRLDISDLNLGGVDNITDNDKMVVGVSKHLCGAATDLTIRCMTGTLAKSRFGGMMIALCCHHRCSWSQYVGQQFLLDQGFQAQEFNILTSISSWATCGFGKKNDKSDINVEDHDVPEFHPNDRYSKLGLDDSRRENIGRKTKRVLDYGRVKYLQKMTDMDVQLKHYVPSEVSLENALLICRKIVNRNI